MSEPVCKVCGWPQHNHGDRHVAGWHDFAPIMTVDCAVCGEAEEHSNHRLEHHFQRGIPYPSPPEVQELFASLATGPSPAHWRARAEAAEAQLAEAEQQWAECREALRRSTATRTRECQRAADAQAKLAALIADVRQFSGEYLRHNRHTLTAGDLERLLAKYEGKP